MPASRNSLPPKRESWKKRTRRHSARIRCWTHWGVSRRCSVTTFGRSAALTAPFMTLKTRLWMVLTVKQLSSCAGGFEPAGLNVSRSWPEIVPLSVGYNTKVKACLHWALKVEKHRAVAKRKRRNLALGRSLKWRQASQSATALRTPKRKATTSSHRASVPNWLHRPDSINNEKLEIVLFKR